MRRKRYEGTYDLEIEKDYLYYANGYSVSRVKLDGSEWEELFYASSPSFTVDNKNIYAYVDHRNDMPARFEIMK